MAKNDFPKATPAGKYPRGHAKENKDANAYTGFKYPEGGGNDIGVYKQPMPNPNGNMTESVTLSGNCMDHLNISVAGISKGNTKGINPYGVKEMRGFGADIKGKKISGKQG